MSKLKIEAVTVCVDYADFLVETLPYNIPHLDRWIIVTEPQDAETREVCRRFNLECILSEDGKRGDEADFNKGRLIERGLRHLSSNGWRLHLDADIVLPNRFVDLLDASHLEEDHIYGFDRVMVRSWADWQRLIATNWLRGGQHDYQNRIRWPEGFAVGSRWGDLRVGWVPIGFSQLWHSTQDEWNGTRIKSYPQFHGSACRADIQHSLYFDRRKRSLVPEVIVAHLESEPAKLGANWKGRKTQRFGPASQSVSFGAMQPSYCDAK